MLGWKEDDVSDMPHVITTALLLMAIVGMAIGLLFLTSNAFALVLGVTGQTSPTTQTHTQ